MSHEIFSLEYIGLFSPVLTHIFPQVPDSVKFSLTQITGNLNENEKLKEILFSHNKACGRFGPGLVNFL